MIMIYTAATYDSQEIVQNGTEMQSSSNPCNGVDDKGKYCEDRTRNIAERRDEGLH
jgi:hypothetical protein